ncbi:hypothetical protein OG331_25000 [Streptomyces sp. NBC_01017]|uniref:hypothetical protein n=1 Tax=Streptomyces sp. NBC_01017 TaxID=2903721 RepID=UPI003866CC7A|nr:hypothetical protein OG331_25000 [Streptomyces sp. NBC_01017]
MSAYSRAYQALTSGRPLRPDEAAQLLAELRKEHGDELADALGKHATEQYRPKPTDSKADDRRKRRAYGAVMRAANLAREIAASPFRATVPPQGDTTNRSTS